MSDACDPAAEAMSCQAYYAALRDYMEDALPVPRRAALERHLADCSACAAFHALAHEITCREIAEFLDDYADQRLALEKCEIFERHLAFCGECKIYLESYRRTIAIGKSAFEEPAERASRPPPEELVRAILAARKKK